MKDIKDITISIFAIISFAALISFTQSNDSDNKVGIQFFLDVKYPDQYENALEFNK